MNTNMVMDSGMIQDFLTGIGSPNSGLHNHVLIPAAHPNNMPGNPNVENSQQNRNMPYIEIVEQPASKALRFRYKCEGRSAGSIPGASSTPEHKTYPTIKIHGYKGKATVLVTCVTKDEPYRTHPHNLVGKDNCSNGFCKVEVTPSENMTVSFNNLGIQCVTRKDIEGALKLREQMNIDPFNARFAHKHQPTSIDLNAVRLCFQVFIKGPKKNHEGKHPTFALQPVVSEPIYDKKAMSDLVICKLSHCSASVSGGTEMVLLCEKVAKEDIQVRFFEERENHTYWEGYGDFQPAHVHKQVAISFRTPTYRNQHIEQPIQVYIQLRRPSDGTTSDPLPFQLLPLGLDDPDSLRRKRQKLNNSPKNYVMKYMQQDAEKQGAIPKMPQYDFNFVKSEPEERPLHFGGQMPGAASPSGYQMTPSPSHNPNLYGLQPEHSPGRTQSPMDQMYNITAHQNSNVSPHHPQNFHTLSPMHGSISPSLIQNQANQLGYCNLPAKPIAQTNYHIQDNSILGANPESVNDLDLSGLLDMDAQMQMNNFNVSAQIAQIVENSVFNNDAQVKGNQDTENITNSLDNISLGDLAKDMFSFT